LWLNEYILSRAKNKRRISRKQQMKGFTRYRQMMKLHSDPQKPNRFAPGFIPGKEAHHG
jgi:hypothetical protein